jgi:hypothetical protein
MKRFTLALCVITTLTACRKSSGEQKQPSACDMNQTYTLNASKTTISTGVFGTVSSKEGNCMPVVMPGSNTCTHCPVKRTILIYEYTRNTQAAPVAGKPGFYQQVSTALVREVDTDQQGFFQSELPPGQYSLFIRENVLLYANVTDANGGLNPVSITSGQQKSDLVMTYKAAF